MFEKEIRKLLSRGFNWYDDLFGKYDVKILKDVVNKELSGEGKLIICFPEKLEELFQEYYFLKSINRIRIMLIFGIFVYIFFGLADYILFPDIYKDLWAIRALTIAAVTPAVFFIFTGKRYTAVYFVYSVIAVTAGLSIIGMMSVIMPHEAQIYYAGIFLVIFFLYTLSGIPFLYTSISSTIIISLYFIIDIFFLHSGYKYLVSNMFFLVSANIMGLIGGYILEYYVRKDFLLSLKIYLDKKDLENLTKKLKHLSNYDELTGLANRRKLKEFFERELRRAVREKFPISVLMIDIDYFKAYNDYYGHLKGDHILKEIGKIINNHARRPTDIAGRWGGEEFIMVLSNINKKQVSAVADDLHRDILNRNIKHEFSPTGRLTVSIGGYTEIPDNTRTIDEFINRADKALYKAKSSGRNSIVLLNGSEI